MGKRFIGKIGVQRNRYIGGWRLIVILACRPMGLQDDKHVILQITVVFSILHHGAASLLAGQILAYHGVLGIDSHQRQQRHRQIDLADQTLIAPRPYISAQNKGWNMEMSQWNQAGAAHARVMVSDDEKDG